ncbi:2-aminoethanethiol (cysteamine) dioxygenase a [Hypanus sabinus]|uniref:2-aminoethanethiol (cysteamine) dioxygenase a n=1 Tax=Hypanus sabinus TaxID=79690 RepID=UPI0028C3B8DB|nr:2-aminoethanethiol (cysteamine) dioxygenase a [Hypanus sabinus]
MPRAEMASLIQKIARQARSTFMVLPSGDAATFQDNLAKLRMLLEKIRAEDLNLGARRNSGPPHQGPPVSYMHICETDCFSMGVFLLQSGACIPLHDHPGMHGLLKVLFGQVTVKCFDKEEEEREAAGADSVQFNPPLLQCQRAALRRSLRRSSTVLSEESDPCLLTPLQGNMHQIEATDGPAAFLDILAPPYDPDEGRDCHYYKVLQVSENAGNSSPPSSQQPQTPPPQPVWLLEVPQPADFWCGGEPYPGPKVSP